MKPSLLLALGLIAPTLFAVPALSAPAKAEKPAPKTNVPNANVPNANVPNAADLEAAAQLFERAAENYGEATNIRFSYVSVIKVDEDSITSRGSLIFEAPARFRLEQTTMRDKSLFVYDGHTLMAQSNDEMPQRVVVRPNSTVWDELPDVSLPDPLIASFLAGENPFGEFVYDATQVKKLPDQTIGGQGCEGISLLNEADEESLTISAWFSRESGLLVRVVTRAGETLVTSDYSKIERDGELAPGTFTLTMGGKNAV